MRQARLEKAAALTEIAIKTAQKVAEIKLQAAVLAANPLTAAFAPFALAQVPLAIAAGGLAATAIAARPIPQYAEGTDYHPGGLAVVGDGGGHELVQTLTGDTYQTPDSATLVDLQRGAKVMDAVTTQNALGGMSEDTAKELIKSNKESSGKILKGMAKIVNERPEKGLIFDRDGVREYTRRKGTIIKKVSSENSTLGEG